MSFKALSMLVKRRKATRKSSVYQRTRILHSLWMLLKRNPLCLFDQPDSHKEGRPWQAGGSESPNTEQYSCPQRHACLILLFLSLRRAMWDSLHTIGFTKFTFIRTQSNGLINATPTLQSERPQEDTSPTSAVSSPVPGYFPGYGIFLLANPGSNGT